jgi:predicted dehydrogenase
MSSLRALIHGSGYAAEGHALALKSAGVDVVAMASRNEEVCRKMATSLGIPRYGTNWRQLLADVRPDIVAVATPAGVREDLIEVAIKQGCHIYSEKPLAMDAAHARTLYELAKAQGIKTAYAATCRYQPQIVFAAELVDSEVLGQLHELEFISHFGQPKLMPFGWIHQLDAGAGRLYNHFPHALSMAERIVGGNVLAVNGSCRYDLKRAPIAGDVHDFRNFSKLALSPDAAAKVQWAEVTSDFSYTALVQIGRSGDPPKNAVTALIKQGVVQRSKCADFVSIYGEKGTLHIERAYGEGSVFLNTTGDEWQELTVPQRLIDGVPGTGTWSHRLWARLAVDLVSDIKNSTNSGCLTFREGWTYQEAIQAVREGKGWTPIPEPFS